MSIDIISTYHMNFPCTSCAPLFHSGSIWREPLLIANEASCGLHYLETSRKHSVKQCLWSRFIICTGSVHCGKCLPAHDCCERLLVSSLSVGARGFHPWLMSSPQYQVSTRSRPRPALPSLAQARFRSASTSSFRPYPLSRPALAPRNWGY